MPNSFNLNADNEGGIHPQLTFLMSDLYTSFVSEYCMIVMYIAAVIQLLYTGMYTDLTNSFSHFCVGSAAGGRTGVILDLASYRRMFWLFCVAWLSVSQFQIMCAISGSVSRGSRSGRWLINMDVLCVWQRSLTMSGWDWLFYMFILYLAHWRVAVLQ